jgi:drug/metabolite transporter (DMT)-like permease
VGRGVARWNPLDRAPPPLLFAGQQYVTSALAAVVISLDPILAAAFALGAVGTQRLRTEFPVKSLLAWMMLVGVPVLHAAAVVLPGEELAAVTWSGTALAGLGYLAVVAAAAGYFLYFELLDRVGAIEINLVAYATPISAAVGGWFVLGERIQPHTVVGFVVILVGFTLVKRHALKAEIVHLTR